MAKSGNGRRRRSYRRQLAGKILLRWVVCLVVVGATVAVVPILVLAVYPACGLYLDRYLSRRAIWVADERAQRIAEAQGRMVLLWPLQAARYVRRLRRRAAPLAAGADEPAERLPQNWRHRVA